MNTVSLIGRITKDIELRFTESQKAVVSFNIAVNRGIKDKDNNAISDFINCVAWEGRAKLLHEYIKKGDRIGINGSIQTRTYQDQSGNNRHVTEILVNNIELLESKRKTNEEVETNITHNNTDIRLNEVSTDLIDDSNLPF